MQTYYLACCAGRGLGVFARKSLFPDDYILTFTGPVVPAGEIRDYTHFFQLTADSYLGPSGLADDYVNHACDPNCAVYPGREGPVLRAIRCILANEELTFDYATILFDEPTEFDCLCRSENCRGRVRGFTTLPAALQQQYLSMNAVPMLCQPGESDDKWHHKRHQSSLLECSPE